MRQLTVYAVVCPRSHGYCALGELGKEGPTLNPALSITQFCCADVCIVRGSTQTHAHTHTATHARTHIRTHSHTLTRAHTCARTHTHATHQLDVLPGQVRGELVAVGHARRVEGAVLGPQRQPRHVDEAQRSARHGRHRGLACARAQGVSMRPCVRVGCASRASVS